MNPYDAGISASGLERRMKHADMLARADDLDMVDAGWEPTAENYLSRVPKVRIVEAVREAKGEGAAQLIDHLKKGEMAVEAERLLKGTGWLPEVLRRSDLVVLGGVTEGQGANKDVSPFDDMLEDVAENSEDIDLPAYLMADLPGDPAQMIAAV